jgi:hypothetical protein
MSKEFVYSSLEYYCGRLLEERAEMESSVAWMSSHNAKGKIIGRELAAAVAWKARKLVKKYGRNLCDGTADIYFAPDIPAKNLRKAFAAYAPGVHEDDVLVLYEESSSGFSDRGLIIDKKGIWFQGANSDTPKHFFYEEIESVYIDSNKISIHFNDVYFINQLFIFGMQGYDNIFEINDIKKELSEYYKCFDFDLCIGKNEFLSFNNETLALFLQDIISFLQHIKENTNNNSSCDDSQNFQGYIYGWNAKQTYAYLFENGGMRAAPGTCEVPAGQYTKISRLLDENADHGGNSPKADGEKITLAEGPFSYCQLRSIAKSGVLDSVSYDGETGKVTVKNSEALHHLKVSTEKLMMKTSGKKTFKDHMLYSSLNSRCYPNFSIFLNMTIFSWIVAILLGIFCAPVYYTVVIILCCTLFIALLSVYINRDIDDTCSMLLASLLTIIQIDNLTRTEVEKYLLPRIKCIITNKWHKKLSNYNTWHARIFFIYSSFAYYCERLLEKRAKMKDC